MKKKAEVHLLPTDKIIAPNGNRYIWAISKQGRDQHLSFDRYMDSVEVPNSHYLYFTTDEEIKEGDWVIQRNFEGTREGVVQYKYYGEGSHLFKKIVATTNPELWYSNEKTERGKYSNLPREIGIHYAEYVANPIGRIGEDFQEKYVKQQGAIKEVILEYDYKGTGSGYHDYEWYLKLRSNGTVIISPVEESWDDILQEFSDCLSKERTGLFEWLAKYYNPPKKKQQ